ncbi:MAG: LAGLIDADG family homing endonuclease, partial [Candidatus Thorarchaeota archaeon]
ERIIGTRLWRPELEPKENPSQKKKLDKSQKKKPLKVKKLEGIIESKAKKSSEAQEIKLDSLLDQEQKSAKNASVIKEIDRSSEMSKKEAKKITENESQTQKQVQLKEKVKSQEEVKTEQKIVSDSSKLLELQQRYRQETGKRPIYNKKHTKNFKEWLEAQKKHLQQRQDFEKKSDTQEEWELLLEKWLNETSENEISKEIKDELLDIIRKHRIYRTVYWRIIQILSRKELITKEKEEIELLIKKLENMDKTQVEIFRNLTAFEAFYRDNIKWYKYRIISARQKFIKHLAQKLENLKRIEKTKKHVKKNWKENLKENLYKNLTLNLNEKSIIINILQKSELTEGDKKGLISFLSKLSTEELISLLGNNFERHTRNYVKWGWDYDQGVKMLMLREFLEKMHKPVATQNDTENYKKNNEIEDERSSYSVIEFFRDIKRQLSCIEKKRFNYRQISIKFLKLKNKWVINDKILHSKGDPDYVIEATLLSIYEKRIKSKIGKEFSKLKKFFERYRSINLNNRLKASINVHPNLDINYFKKIDSIRKAYWLGWLYAEGHLSRKFLIVQIGVKDGILIKRFIKELGFNPRKVHFYRRYDPRSHRYSWRFSIKINNKEFRDHLRNLGFPVGKKSDIIRFPDFSNPLFASIKIKKELDLAFILGFFDGDGSHGCYKGEPNSPVIVSKSKEFLNDIISLSNLPSYIRPRPKFDKHGNFKGYYYLGIGAKFFMKLLENFSYSLPRKRVKYTRFYGKFLFSKEQLQKIVNNNPLITAKEIAALHQKLHDIEISPRTVNDRLKNWNIIRISKDEYYRMRTIELRLKGWSLKRIYENEFKFKNWGTYSKAFFERIFKNDQNIGNKDDIHKKIAEFYKPSKSV